MRLALIVAFDGLQPAQVTAELTPNLAQFAAEGVAFDNHHPVYPSVTRANAASIVTGRHPGGHGLAANVLAMRDVYPHAAFSAMQPSLADVARKAPVLFAPTLADILAQHGLEYVAVGTGTSGNAYLHNPNAERVGGATIHPEFCLPYALHEDILARFGEWPAEGVDQRRQAGARGGCDDRVCLAGAQAGGGVRVVFGAGQGAARARRRRRSVHARAARGGRAVRQAYGVAGGQRH